MPTTTGGGPTIYYETRGDPADPPLIMVEGFTAQLVGWREDFLRGIVERGIFVIVFDNRDVGLSQQMGGDDLADAGYSLSDMAGDGFRVLDALGLQRAHVAGQSMGGMIAQRMAIEQPQRVRSLTLIYTAPAKGRYRVTQTLAQNFGAIPPRLPRQEAIAAQLEHEGISRSPAYDWDEAWAEHLAGLSFDRGYSPAGHVRQYAAISRMGDNLPELEGLDVPAAIIHGRDDGHIRVDAALDMGRALRNSEVHIYPGMGHELVRPLWDEFAEIIARTVARGCRT